MKSQRQAALLDLIDREAFHSQELLRRRLRHRGFDATQATISRDIRDLGLVKRASDGAYQRPGANAPAPETALDALERAAAEYMRTAERVQQLVVIRTGVGQAQPLAIARLRNTIGRCGSRGLSRSASRLWAMALSGSPHTISMKESAVTAAIEWGLSS